METPLGVEVRKWGLRRKPESLVQPDWGNPIRSLRGGQAEKILKLVTLEEWGIEKRILNPRN